MRSREFSFNPEFEIPVSELRLEPTRSGGKGGQNVNKVATRITLSWNIEGSTIFTPEQKNLLQQKLKNRINKIGELILHCDTHRTQLANKKEIVKRLQALVQEALHKDPERYETRVSRREKEKRLEAKRRQSAKRQRRQQPDFNE